MRLDKYLKVSRLIKRRTVANEVSDMGRVLVNGTPAKPSKQLKEGDVIEIEYANRTVCVRVLKIPQNTVSVQESLELYKIIPLAKKKEIGYNKEESKASEQRSKEV